MLYFINCIFFINKEWKDLILKKYCFKSGNANYYN